MKRAISILLMILLVFTITACKKSDNTGTPDTSTPGTSTPGTSTPGTSTPGTSTPPDSSPVEQDGAQYGGVIRVNSTAEGAAPVGATWKIPATEVFFTYPMHETLVNELSSGEIVPWLAESYDIDVENATVTFKIREGVKFHDGSDLNADVVKWHLDMVANDGLSPVTYTEVEIIGDYEVKVYYPMITNSTMATYTYRNYCITSKQAFETKGEEWLTENPIGTGPYKFVEYSKSAYMKFERFDDYWMEGQPYPDAFEIHLIRDTMTQNIALQSTGDQSIDMVSTQSGDQIKTFRDLGYDVYSNPTGPMNLIPSSGNPDSPFAIKEVREALSYALDRDAIVAARGFGVLTPAYQMIAKGFSGHSDDPNFGVPGYNVEKAKELLAEAGYPNGFKTTLYGQPGMADKDAVVAVQAQLKAIGIDASVEMPDAGGYSDLRGNGWEGIIVQHNRAMARMEAAFRLLYAYDTRTIKSIAYTQELETILEAAINVLGDNSKELLAFQTYMMDNFITIPIYDTYESWICKSTVNGYQGGSFIMAIPNLWLS